MVRAGRGGAERGHLETEARAAGSPPRAFLRTATQPEGGFIVAKSKLVRMSAAAAVARLPHRPGPGLSPPAPNPRHARGTPHLMALCDRSSSSCYPRAPAPSMPPCRLRDPGGGPRGHDSYPGPAAHGHGAVLVRCLLSSGIKVLIISS